MCPVFASLMAASAKRWASSKPQGLVAAFFIGGPDVARMHGFTLMCRNDSDLGTSAVAYCPVCRPYKVIESGHFRGHWPIGLLLLVEMQVRIGKSRCSLEPTLRSPRRATAAGRELKGSPHHASNMRSARIARLGGMEQEQLRSL